MSRKPSECVSIARSAHSHHTQNGALNSARATYRHSRVPRHTRREIALPRQGRKPTFVRCDAKDYDWRLSCNKSLPSVSISIARSAHSHHILDRRSVFSCILVCLYTRDGKGNFAAVAHAITRSTRDTHRFPCPIELQGSMPQMINEKGGVHPSCPHECAKT